MRICEIHIEEFGGLKNKHVTLDSGFNLLCGTNESGKTTLCNFIKYIFYGFSGSDERAEMSNFKTGASSGYIIIDEGNGVKYRIARRDSEKSKGRINVIKEPEGSEFTIWKDYALTPGDYFFGVTEKLYSRSVYVSQKGGAELDGGSAEAINNLLISGDEATNLNKAKSSLEHYRKSLKLKKGRGGRISETEDSIQRLKEKFERGAQTKDSLSEINASIKRLEDDKAAYTDQLQKVRVSLANAKTVKINDLLKARGDLKKRREELDECEKQLIAENTVNGFLPDSEYMKELALAENAAEMQKKSHDSLKEKITSITNEKRLTVPSGYKEYSEMGGKGTVKERYKKLSTSKRTLQFFAISAAILSFTSIISFFIPESFQIPIERNTSFALASTVAVLFFGLLCTRLAVKLHKINKKLCITSKRIAEKAFEEFDTYEKSLGNDFRSLNEALNESEKTTADKLSELEKLVKAWGKSTPAEAKESYQRYTADMQNLKTAKDEVNQNEYFNSAQLSIYTEAEITEAESMSHIAYELPTESVTEKTATELGIKIDNVKGELRELEIRRAEICGGGIPKLDKLAIEIGEKEALLRQLNFNYDAAELAIEALGIAENGIRHTVSPYLSEVSGEYFTALTKKRYSGLLLDESMSLKYREGEDGPPIDSTYLSGGSSALAWICLRLALHKKLSESRPLPIILDECFVYFDDTRLKAILKKLTDISAKTGTQILLFSASNREKDILQKTVNTVKI